MQLNHTLWSKYVASTLQDDEYYAHSAYFQGNYQRKTAFSVCFFRIVFAVIKQRAMAYFAERHDALGFLGKKIL